MFENMTQTADTYMDLEETSCIDLGIEEVKKELLQIVPEEKVFQIAILKNRINSIIAK